MSTDTADQAFATLPDCVPTAAESVPPLYREAVREALAQDLADDVAAFLRAAAGESA